MLGDGTQVTYGDDECEYSGGSAVYFNLTQSQTAVIHEGCFGFESCGGTLVISLSDVKSLSPAVAPTLSPTPVPAPLCNVTINEYKALQSFYKSTNGPSWNSKCSKGWNFPSPPDYTAPCKGWNGVICQDCSIIYLFLDQCNLQGSLPTEIGYLSNLQLLELVLNRYIY
jgi:hypothetical protein